MPNSRKSHKRKKRRKGLGKVKKDIKWLKMNIEFKFKDVDLTPVCLDAGVVSTVCTGVIAQSDGVTGRTGNEITARRMFIRGYIHNDRGTPGDCIVRILVLRDKSPNGAAPTIANIFSGTFGGLLGVNSPYNISLAPRLKVYADYTFSMDTLGHSEIPFKFSQKLNHHVNYAGASTAEPVLNGFYMVFISNVANDANAPAVRLTARFSFCDS